MRSMRHESWDPLRRLQEELGLPGNAASWRASDDNSHVATSHWSPPVDIKEEADRFVLLADLPGVDPGNVEVSMTNGVLSVSGERAHSDGQRTQEAGYSRVERATGTFHRRFTLPDNADEGKIAAKMNQGVLEVVIPKKTHAKPRKITVSG